MGADAADFDGSGWPALWVTNYEGELHALYRNIVKGGRQYFAFATSMAGIAAIGQQFVGFGTGFLDLDNDGWEDLFISNGHVIRHPFPAPLAQRPVLFRNAGLGKFREVSKSEGKYFQTGHRGRGVAIGDLNNDGLPDIIVSHVQESVAILRNVTAPANHWVGVQLVGRDRRSAVGAKVTLEANKRTLTRFAKGGASYLSANDSRIIFGLGHATQAGKLVVHWDSGTPRVESWHGLATDTYHRLEQGKGQVVEVK